MKVQFPTDSMVKPFISNVTSIISRQEAKSKKKAPRASIGKCGKIQGRQIMNRNHDPVKANAMRKRQITYSNEVRSSKRNSVALHINSITRVVVQSFKKLIDCERCALFLMDSTTNELFFKPVGDEHGSSCGEIRFPVSTGVAGWVASTRHMVNIKNAYQDPRFNPEIDKQTNFRTRTILCMPVLSSKGNLFGVIQMVNKKKGDVKKIISDAKKKKSDPNFHGYESAYEEFSKDDEDTLKKCCEQTSVALESVLGSSSFSAGDGMTQREASNYPDRTSVNNDTVARKGSTASRRDSRRGSIGSLVQFVSTETGKNNRSTTEGLFGIDVSVTEALMHFHFRSTSGQPAKGELDPERLYAASMRKKMVDYSSMRRKSMSEEIRSH